MAVTPAVDHGVTNSTTDVTVVSSPGASEQKLIRNITVYNADTVSATVILKLDDGGTERILVRATLATLETLNYTDLLVLDETDQEIQIVLSGAVTANQLQFTAHYALVT
jgi:hypothetical protein